MISQPFKTGDFVTAGGVTGTIEAVGLFVTTIDTLDNVRTIVGNNKIFSDNIQNFSTNPYRRVNLVAQLAHSVPASGRDPFAEGGPWRESPMCSPLRRRMRNSGV